LTENSLPSAEATSVSGAEAASTRRSGYWFNLTAAGLLLFYGLFSAWQLVANGLCIQLAVDYCDYWSTGQVATRFGYAQVYDVGVLGSVEKTIMPAGMDTTYLATNPFPYLPVFAVPFQLLARPSPAAGFWLFTICSAVTLILYLRFFMQRLNIASGWQRLSLLIVVSLPGFMNLLTGQVEVLLAVCVGEFLRALIDRRPFRAGLWLGGLLLKPQTLLLIGLILLLHRAVKVLAGLTVTSALLLLGSLPLGGPEALTAMIRLWLGYGTGDANVWVEGMMNLRMLGMRLSALGGPWLGWGFVALSVIGVVLTTLYVWRSAPPADSPLLPISILGVFAATTLVAWHAQIHMALLLVAPLLYLYQTRALPERVFNYWVFVPATLFVAMTFIPEALAALGIVQGNLMVFVYFVLGLGELTANLLLFLWAVRASLRLAPAMAFGERLRWPTVRP